VSAVIPATPGHVGLADGRWQQLTLVEQLANIGSEYGRAARARAAENVPRLEAALDRCLELFDLSLADDRWRGRRRELARAREVVCRVLLGTGDRRSEALSLDRYFLAFAVAAPRRRPVSGRALMS